MEVLKKYPCPAACVSQWRQPSLFGDDTHAVVKRPKWAREHGRHTKCGPVVSVGCKPGQSTRDRTRTRASMHVRPRHLVNEQANLTVNHHHRYHRPRYSQGSLFIISVVITTIVCGCCGSSCPARTTCIYCVGTRANLTESFDFSLPSLKLYSVTCASTATEATQAATAFRKKAWKKLMWADHQEFEA